ncbi:MAG TPA: pitrilysin family protein [Gemmataceae bacterium]|nr:pitrilysin family protein [Gemmataceae bacterium]
MTFYKHALKNGLRIIGETNSSARSVALGFFVRTGSRDETAPISGVTHFLEHMVFKGTPRRTALDVNRDFDRIGAHYNAFTSEENTVFYAAILPEYLPESVDILADILRPSLRTEDFDMEKKVIIEEIGMYEDQPMWSAYDAAKRAHFAGHPLANSILGSVESIKSLKRDQMHSYFKRRYVAPNITVVAAGRFPWKRLLSLVDKHCGGWERGAVGRKGVRETKGAGTFQVVKKEKVTQEHVFMISPGPPVESPLRYAADILATVVGDDSGSRLYWALVDPGLADSADTSFHDYQGTGSFYTSFSCDPSKVEKNLEITAKILREVRQNGITEDELRQAKSKIGSRVVRGSERPMGRMQAIGMTWTYLQTYRTVDQELKAFDSVSLKTIREVLDRYPIDRFTTLALGPMKKVRAPITNGKKIKR